jgi:hypothetical protein
MSCISADWPTNCVKNSAVTIILSVEERGPADWPPSAVLGSTCPLHGGSCTAALYSAHGRFSLCRSFSLSGSLSSLLADFLSSLCLSLCPLPICVSCEVFALCVSWCGVVWCGYRPCLHLRFGGVGDGTRSALCFCLFASFFVRFCGTSLCALRVRVNPPNTSVVRAAHTVTNGIRCSSA